MTAKLTYTVFGGKPTARTLTKPGRVDLDDIPDGVSVLFAAKGGDVLITVGPSGEHRRWHRILDGAKERAIDVPVGPVYVRLLARDQT